MVSGQVSDDEFRRQVDDAVLVIFTLVSESVGWATTALLDQDVERANRVIADDDEIDGRCAALVALVKERLSTVPPDPEELDNLIAVLQIVPELERSADLAEHIAQRALHNVGGTITPQCRGLIHQMGEIAVRMWKVAGTGYRQRSRDAGIQLAEADDELDDLATSLVNETVRSGADPQVAVDMALIARFYERLGDHAVNLARRVDTMAAPRRLSSLKKLAGKRSPAPPAPGEKKGRTRRLLGALSRFKIAPTDEGFFDLFEAAAANGQDCADELRKLIASFSDVDEHFERIKAFERRGDQITIDLLRRLDASFVTPFDREDIHKLAEELDDVVDEMFAAASLIHLVPVDQPLPQLAELAEVLVSMTEELVALVGCLHKGDGARFRLERIEHLERQGDAIFRRSMSHLFSGDFEALEVIKWKDIVQSLEDALNAIEDVSDVVESILVKNS